jgi:hypothetical protein
MTDTFWINVRYILIAAGVALATKYLGSIFNEASATTLITPIVDIIIGLVMAGGAAAWGNYVRAGTKAVPVATANRTDVPTVSPVSGQVQK